MLQLTRSHFVCTESPESIAEMRRSFERDHAIRLPQFFAPPLLALVRQHVRLAKFADHDNGIARETCMEDNPILALLYLVANDDRLFTAVRAITGCESIRSFFGRVYSMQAAAGHYDRWHSDATDTRLIGMSVNLTEEQFAGGVFELRRTAVQKPHWTIANTGRGDAILFEISESLRHRVRPVEGCIARVAYAGWFQSRPDFLTLLKRDTAQRRDEKSVAVY